VVKFPEKRGQGVSDGAPEAGQSRGGEKIPESMKKELSRKRRGKNANQRVISFGTVGAIQRKDRARRHSSSGKLIACRETTLIFGKGGGGSKPGKGPTIPIIATPKKKAWGKDERNHDQLRREPNPYHMIQGRTTSKK